MRNLCRKQLPKASCTKSTPPARSPVAAAGLNPFDADAIPGQIEAFQSAVFLQSLGKHLAVNNHHSGHHRSHDCSDATLTTSWQNRNVLIFNPLKNAKFCHHFILQAPGLSQISRCKVPSPTCTAMIPESHIRGDKSRQPKQIPLAQWVPVAHRVTEKIMYIYIHVYIENCAGLCA